MLLLLLMLLLRVVAPELHPGVDQATLGKLGKHEGAEVLFGPQGSAVVRGDSCRYLRADAIQERSIAQVNGLSLPSADEGLREGSSVVGDIGRGEGLGRGRGGAGQGEG